MQHKILGHQTILFLPISILHSCENLRTENTNYNKITTDYDRQSSFRP